MESAEEAHRKSIEEAHRKRVATVLSIGDCIDASEVDALLKLGRPPRCYNGFEPSGRLTFAQCMTAVVNVNKLTSVGFHFTFWVADLFAQLNNKLSGDMKKIRKAGELMIETWRAAGLNMDRVQFVWASEAIEHEQDRYWKLVIDITRKFTLSRMRRCTPALGREDSDELPLSTMMYAAMQCADILFLDVDMCQMGSDQLRINTLSREYCEKIGRKRKPIILSHKILGGIDGKDKMSKSSPDTALFMDDPPAEINRKIKSAFCAEGDPTGPLFDLLEAVIMQLGPLYVQRSVDNGGDVTFNEWASLREMYAAGKLHPGDLKSAVARRINEILAPVQTHLTTNCADLLRTVKSYKLTK